MALLAQSHEHPDHSALMERCSCSSEGKTIPPDMVRTIFEIALVLQRLNVRGACIPTSILIAEIAAKRAYPMSVKVGLLCIDQKYATFHCWNEILGVKLDVSRMPRTLEEQYISSQLVEGFECPKGADRIDTDTEEADQVLKANIALIEVYETKGAEALWQLMDDRSEDASRYLKAGQVDARNIFATLRGRYVTLSICHTCGGPARQICAKCRHEAYCNKKCQTLRWQQHRKYCSTRAR